jgi:hypothetical protein
LDFVSLSEMRDIDFQIGVENRDYHHLSQSEIGGKRTSDQFPIWRMPSADPRELCYFWPLALRFLSQARF